MGIIILPILDTRFFIEFFGQKNSITLKILKEIAKQRAYISVISLHELYKFFAEKKGVQIAEHRIRLLQSTYEIIPVDQDIAITAVKIRLHKKIPTADNLIGATAIGKDNVVISDDPHFGLIKELKVQWL